MHGFLRGMDPYSDFLDADAYRALKEEPQGRFGEIGIRIRLRDGLPSVTAPMEDTPSYRADILQGVLARRPD